MCPATTRTKIAISQMSLHKRYADDAALNQALIDHRLPHDKPSQLADAFRTGWLAARREHPTLTPDQQRAIIDSRNRSMDWCVRGRIPESGEFAQIAQSLDWLCSSLGITPDD